MPRGPITLTTLMLLHESGWDEVIMVAVGLVVAYAVIIWTGRRQTDDEDEPEGHDADLADPPPDGSASDRPTRPPPR